MARNSKSGPVNNAGRPTGSYSSYGTSGYGAPYGGGGYGGYGGAGNGGYGGRGPSPYGGYGARSGAPMPPQQQQQAQVPATVEDTKNKGKEKAGKSGKKDNGNMNRKDKKLAKKQEHFKEDQVKYYPMSIGAWIGTFILLAIPVVGGICAICWFFGVGNRSRVAWVRSKLVAFLLIIALIAAIFGIGYAVVSSKAKNVEVVFDGVSYGTLGEYKAKGTLYYVACFAVDLFGEKIIGMVIGSGEGEGGEGDGEISSGEAEEAGEQGKDAIKLMLAKKLGFKPKTTDTENKGDGEIGSGEGETGSGEGLE